MPSEHYERTPTFVMWLFIIITLCVLDEACVHASQNILGHTHTQQTHAQHSDAAGDYARPVQFACAKPHGTQSTAHRTDKC